MTAFATYSDLEARLGITMTAAEQTRAGTLLALATSVIQKVTKQTISAVSNDVWTIRGESSNRLRLPERPVNSVASVTLDGETIGSDDYYVEGDELVRSSWPTTSEKHFGSGGSWGGEQAVLVVTYSHGYAADAIPSIVKAVCVEMVARVWANPGSAKAEGFGNESVTYGDTRGLFPLDYEREMLLDVVGRQAGTVRCR